LRALSDPATADLVRRAQRGETAAFEGLARAYLRAAYSVALGVVSRPADAEDVAQEAFVVAVEKIETCREPERFAGWLFAIVRTRALNWLDRRRLRDVPREAEQAERAGDAPRVERGQERARLVAALDELSAVQREVVLLHDLEDWTHAEIAGALGISEVMSRQHLFQARRILRGQLAEHAPSEVNDEQP
jgi:RNA polymerase sigma-70 factor, ECF subfamily